MVNCIAQLNRAFRLDDQMKAVAYLNQAIDLYHRTQDRLGEAKSLRAMGVAYSRMANFDATRTCAFTHPKSASERGHISNS